MIASVTALTSSILTASRSTTFSSRVYCTLARRQNELLQSRPGKATDCWTIHRSDQHATSRYTVLSVTVVTMSLPAPGAPESFRSNV